MVLPAAGPVGGVGRSHPLLNALGATRSHGSWLEDLDDVPLTGNDPGEPDMERAVVVDEEALLEGPSTSGRQEVQETLKLLLSGGVAGAVSKSATAPLARLTILYQVQGLQTATAAPSLSIKSLGIRAALAKIISQEGAAALWKGNGVTIIHRLPYSSANFWTYERVNELWKERIPAQGHFELGDVTRRLFAGGVAGMTACTLAYPLDLVRTRLAAQTTRRYYRGIGHALATIVRDEGGFGLYRGLGATLMQVAPSLAINYAAYETVRSYWLARSGRSTPTVATSLACGSLAGLVSSTATFPLDLVRRRMQLQGQGGTGQLYGSVRGALGAIAKREGVRGLYAGILPEYLKVIPGVAIAFCTYELMKATLEVQTNATNR